MARTCSAARTAVVCAVALGVFGQLTRAAEQTPRPKAPLTLSGCLRADGRSFVLTDLKGNQAPKKRNWKTAYITKTTKKDLVISPAGGVNLRNQVDRQVTVVGVVDGSRFAARSVKRVAASCA